MGHQKPDYAAGCGVRPIRLRAFGTFALKVTDAAKFIKEIAGTQAHFTTEEVSEQLRNLVFITRFTDAVAESKIPALDLAANYDELSKFISAKINPEFGEYGLEITKFLVENISLPPEVEQALDKRSSMGILGNLNQYAQFQAANAMEAAAKNPGGGAGEGMGMGMGFAMAQQMGQMSESAKSASRAARSSAHSWWGNTVLCCSKRSATRTAYRSSTSADGATGILTRDTLVWKQGMPSWIKASDVAQLNTMFGAVPPPLPPQ